TTVTDRRSNPTLWRRSSRSASGTAFGFSRPAGCATAMPRRTWLRRSCGARSKLFAPEKSRTARRFPRFSSRRRATSACNGAAPGPEPPGRNNGCNEPLGAGTLTMDVSKILDCNSVEEQDLVSQYVGRKLSPEEAEAFEEHYFGCDRCWAEVQGATELRAALANEGRSQRERSVYPARVIPGPRRHGPFVAIS